MMKSGLPLLKELDQLYQYYIKTTVPQKEETFQVVIDIIKNSTCFKAFTISANVLEIFMQQFRYDNKKVQDNDSYEFLSDNKKCTINAEVFRTILDICPRVEGVDFTNVPDDDTALTFLIDLAIRTASNDKHKKYRIEILWGMFNIENVDYPELIWEDFAYQINHRKEKGSRRENMPPRFTKIIINNFLKQHKSLTNLNHNHYHTIKEDRIISRLKFARIVKDYQEYEVPIPNVMLNDATKHLESYRMFIKYSKNQIPPKKSRGKCSKGKKTVEESQETINIFKESKPEPEPTKKKTSSKRTVKKKVTLSTDEKIIFDDPDAALEIMTKSAKKKSSGRSSNNVVIQDTPSAPKSKPATSKTKLKGAPFLTSEEHKAADIMQVLKESKKSDKRQPGTKGSHEGIGTIPGVPYDPTVFSTTSSEGISSKTWVPNKEKDITKEKVILNWEDEQDSKHSEDNDDIEKDDKDGDANNKGDDHVSDTQDADDEDDKTESDEDEIYKYKIRVHKDDDVEMKDAEVEESNKGEEKVTDAAKEEAKKTLKAKDDTKKYELPSSSSNLYVSSGFSDQFLKLYSDSSLVSTVKDSAYTNVSSLPTPIPTSPITTDALTIITAVHESDALFAVELRVAKLEKDVSELKTIDHSFETFAVLRSQVLTVIDSYLDTKVRDEQTEKQKKQQFTIKSTDTVAIEEYDLKSALCHSMHANKWFNRNPANHRLYHALMEALIEDENALDKGFADTIKDHKRKHDDDEDDDDKDPPAGPK
nr:hypothetical protein [Tanacetum cinerariifolium]